MGFFQKPFGYEPILTKDDLKQVVQKKKGPRASDWKSTLLRLWKIVDEQRALLIVVLLLVMISSVLALAGPYLIGQMIDHYVMHGKLSGLGKGIGFLIGIYALLAVSLFLQNYWMIGIAQQTIYRLRTSVFAHFQRLPIAFFDRRQHGELMSRMTNDIEAVSSTLNSSFIQVFSSILTLGGTVIIMLSLSPLLTVLTMTIIPLMFWAMRWITRRTAPLYKEQQAALGALNGMIEETISGQRIVKAFSQEERMKAEFREKSLRLRRTGFWAQTYSGYIPKVMNFLNNMSFTIVAGIGGVLALYGHVSIGVIVIFTEYARQFTRPLNDLANQFNTVLSAIAGAERVFALLDEQQEEETVSAQKHQLLGHVAFKHVFFKYEQEEEAYTLKDVDFKVEPGQSVALVGATGAGKTTILQLIARFYEVTKGEVLFDGINVQQIDRQSLRSQMAFVLQDPFLFEASVRENIRYGRLDASDAEIEEAAKRANAHDFIMKLKDGYETVLAADGREISQGQKQLLSIARALIADPKILLLDEATSSIDTVTEMAIQEALDTLMQGRTSFVIAHRLNTVHNADLVLVMHKGKLVEAGPQQKLIESGGLYAQMLHSSSHHLEE
ncbi:ABC transporter ATP-binding protein [Lysinibacillus irui]|uniref:ABC transporter ATP-binding protein n=1 Tax=Lysinibacillus irui TaxID=2998077 RepID=A0ABU5NGP4_9BACI|nr:ABC transporter ATP-binding protein [Lysinibacillus irui]MEA0553842.1 ABC transporter ATP-binding protein [Lysinibacillus irui]MEA0975216.1 ABC transporter ATP-binding protein [Lysinibacillus irui]MEA1041370.1 ABC transporter ATP-binding protein [Lysinibacillus irui]